MIGSPQRTQQIIDRRSKMISTTLQQQQRQPWMMLIITSTLAFVWSSSSVVVINAFATFIPAQQLIISSNPSSPSINSLLLDTKYRYAAPFPVRLASANMDEGTTEQEAASTAEGVEVTTESTDETETVTEITATDDNTSAEVAPPVEDPEITAMKEEIAKMEQEIKSARRQLADINDRADDYTKTGYARKVAEMENMRRARSMLQSSNKYTATAAILTEFLPAMDALNALKERYETNEFGKMYNALPDAIRGGFTSMGCTEYTVEPNTLFDSNRMISIDTVPSTTVPKDCVISTVIPGMELQGNTIRLAQVVSSSGSSDAATPETP